MHELSICYALLGQLEALAQTHGSERVLRVELSVGPLAGVEPELLLSAFPLAAQGSNAEDANLVLTEGVVKIHCRACDETREVPSNRLLCPKCGTWRTRLVAGDELLLLRVELEPRKEPCHV